MLSLHKESQHNEGRAGVRAARPQRRSTAMHLIGAPKQTCAIARRVQATYIDYTDGQEQIPWDPAMREVYLGKHAPLELLFPPAKPLARGKTSGPVKHAR